MPTAMQPDMQASTSFDLDRAARHLAARGRSLDFYPVVESTMRTAHQLALRAEINSGSVVLADAQRAGRGRLDRRWEAPPGSSLLLSILLKASGTHPDNSLFPLIAGLAVQRALAGLDLPGVAVGLKWPNDVLLRTIDGTGFGDERKVAGILIESTLGQERMTGHVIVGIGINVAQTAAELPIVAPPAPQPTSLQLAGGAPVDRTDLFISVCQHFDGLYMRRPDELRRAWREVLWTLGRQVTVHYGDGATLRGKAVDVGEDGSLIVEDGAGVRHIVNAGDVSLHAA